MIIIKSCKKKTGAKSAFQNIFGASVKNFTFKPIKTQIILTKKLKKKKSAKLVLKQTGD